MEETQITELKALIFLDSLYRQRQEDNAIGLRTMGPTR